MARGYVETRWGQTHYREAGPPDDAAPTLVLIHESPISSAEYERALPRLGRALRVVAFDIPGYGLSDPPPTPQEIPQYAEALIEAVQALGLGRFAIGGLHTGASIALQMALQAPSAVTHAVFVGIPLIGRRARAQLLESWAPPMELASDGSHFDTIWQRYASQRSMPPDFLTLLDASLFTVHERYNWAYNAAFRYDPAADLPRLRGPVLFVNSEADVLIAADRRAVEMVPDGRLIAVPGETHPLPWQVPERFAEAVIDFVMPS